MAMTPCYGGVHRAIGIDYRHGWWRTDFLGSNMLRYCKKQPRMKLHVSDMGVSVAYNFGNGLSQGMNGSDDRKTIGAEYPDHWLHNSLTEIVKNVGEAPLLVHIYTEDRPKHRQLSSTTNMKYVMEKVTSQSWTHIKQRWDNSCCTNSIIPCGIILVEELAAKQANAATKKQECQDKLSYLDSITTNCSNNTYNNNDNKNLRMESSSSSPATRLWGVLVQGKGVNLPTCYLLKTCQVNCCFGSTTHFCLAKVDNNYFGNSVEFHLNKFWLQM